MLMWYSIVFLFVLCLYEKEVRVNAVHVGKREISWVTEAISWELRGLREETSHELRITAVNTQNAQIEGETSPSAIQMTSSRGKTIFLLSNQPYK